jgi:hypothetical protein
MNPKPQVNLGLSFPSRLFGPREPRSTPNKLSSLGCAGGLSSLKCPNSREPFQGSSQGRDGSLLSPSSQSFPIRPRTRLALVDFCHCPTKRASSNKKRIVAYPSFKPLSGRAKLKQADNRGFHNRFGDCGNYIQDFSLVRPSYW